MIKVRFGGKTAHFLETKMATAAQRKKLILGVDKKLRGEVRTAMETYIEYGDILLGAKNDVTASGHSIYDKHGGFEAWCEKVCGVKYRQQVDYKRVAVHKAQVRQIINGGGQSDLKSIMRQIPRLKQPPLLAEPEKPADAKPARDSNDWHTPEIYINAALDVMGGIDLDPFSSREANEHLCARHILTVGDNALLTDWAGYGDKVWMNPPYGNKRNNGSATATDAAAKFAEEYQRGSFKEGIVLMNLAMDTEWFQLLFGVSSVICCTDHRIKFEAAGGKKQSSNTKSQMFFYAGDNPDKFAEVFSQFGTILTRHAACISEG